MGIWHSHICDGLVFSTQDEISNKQFAHIYKDAVSVLVIMQSKSFFGGAIIWRWTEKLTYAKQKCDRGTKPLCVVLLIMLKDGKVWTDRNVAVIVSTGKIENV